MTDHRAPAHGPGQTARQYPSAWALQEVHAAIQRMVRGTGGQFVIRPIISTEPDGPAQGDAEPLTGLGGARDAELAARRLALRHVRAAREDGHSWAEISTALGQAAGGDDGTGETIAEAAFRYAAGPPDSHWNRTYGPSVTWRCPACRGLIRDHGLVSGPRDDEPGHAGGCERLAAAAAAWEALLGRTGPGGLSGGRSHTEEPAGPGGRY